MKSSNPKKIAFFDFASTIVRGYFIGPFYLYFAEKYLPDRFDEVKTKDEEMTKRIVSGELDYNQITVAVIDTLADLIRGQKVQFVQKAARDFLKEAEIFAYVNPLFDYLYGAGFEVKILTADFEFMIGSVLNRLPQGFSLYPSCMQIKDGVFTGKIDLMHNADFKLDTVRKIEAEHPEIFTLAFGDSQGDIPMLEASDLGFFINEERKYFDNLVKHDHIVHIDNPDSPEAADRIIREIENMGSF